MSDKLEIPYEKLRQAGFTQMASKRDEIALRLLCAFVGVDWRLAPPAWWAHPNDSSRDAWKRVADEAKVIFGEEHNEP